MYVCAEGGSWEFPTVGGSVGIATDARGSWNGEALLGTDDVHDTLRVQVGACVFVWV